MDARDVRALARRALDANGVRRSLLQTEWDVSGDCEAPVPVTVAGRTDRGVLRDRGRTYFQVRKDVIYETSLAGAPHWVDLQVRCGRCLRCRRHRRRIWQGRARAEVAAAARTWLCTFTASPHARLLYELRASRRLAEGGTEYTALSIDEQFRERAKEMGRALTKYWKRVRKRTRAPLRYMAVFEEHKDGAPHIHALLHEVDLEQPVRWSVLNSEWDEGFSHFRLLTSGRGSDYAAKYLTKSVLCRVRASVRYGAPAENALERSSF